MKLHFAIATIAALLSASVFADPSLVKPASQIDFNKMINENNANKIELEQEVGHKLDQSSNSDSKKVDDKAKVLDLIDVEVGLTEDRPIVDRRFNSVEAPRLAKPFELQLVKKN